MAEQAYEQLLAEGWLEARRGAGTFVAATGAAPPAAPRAGAAPAPTADLVRLDAGTPWIDPRHAAGWRRAWREVSTARPPRGYDDPRGLPELRTALAERLGPHPRAGRRPRRGGAHQRHHRRAAAPAHRRSRPDRSRSRTPATGPRSRPSAAWAARSATSRRSRRSTDLTGVVGGVRHPRPPAPARPGDARRRTGSRCSTPPARPARVVVEDDYDSEFRYDVAPVPGAGQPRPVPGRLPRHRREVGRAVACGWAGWSRRPTCSTAVNAPPRGHPRGRALAGAAGVPRAAARRLRRQGGAHRAPGVRRPGAAGRGRARAVRRARRAARRDVLDLAAPAGRRAAGPGGGAARRASR